jgi:hypothetical protein
MTSTDHWKRVGDETVQRAETLFGNAIQIIRPQMAAQLVLILPPIPERFETVEENLLSARITRALMHEQRGEHRARRSPN